jgi:UDP-glucose 4-epimerase
MKVLVTGGAGFIGHHLVSALIARGDDVAILDDFSTGSRDRVARSGARIVEGDLRTGLSLLDALHGCEVVFHEAAMVSVARSVVDPIATNSVNVDGTLRLMVEAANAGVRRVIVASSSAVYGASAELPSRETQRPDPQSPYATSKLAVEHYVHNVGAANGIETVALRYFNVFGPGQDPAAEYAAVVPRFITAGLGSGRPVVYGDGLQSRDFTYVDDVVAANLLAADTSRITGLTVNIGSGERSSLLDLLAAVGQAVGRTLDHTFEPVRRGDVRHSQADISLAAEQLGYRASVDLAEGIRRSVAWYRDSAKKSATAG